MAETTTAPAAESNDKILAVVASLPLIGLIMFYAMKDASPLVKHYAQQSNALLALSILVAVVNVIPVLGQIISCIAWVASIVFQILLIVKALNEDKTYVLPVIGKYFENLMK